MTRTAIIAAMPGELKPLVRGWQHERRSGVDLWRFRHDEGEWIAACAGAGVDAATRAFAEVEKDGPIDRVTSTGWAGALNEKFRTGQAYRVSGAIDTRTGERFDAISAAQGIEALKGFSRAAEAPKTDSALAAEGVQADNEALPQGLKPGNSLHSPTGTAEAVPFQNGCLLVTSSKVADEPEKRRLATAYDAALVDMEAAAIARLAQMRGIPFYCIKGVSDSLTDRLPDFNRFIDPNGRFQAARFALFALLRPWHWPALARMGENSRKAAEHIAESLLDILDERRILRQQNGDPNLKR